MHSALTSTTSSSMSIKKCLELYGQLEEVQDELQRLKEENENLRKENETLREIQRIDDQICELRKE